MWDAGQEIMADDGAGTDGDFDAARERGDRVTHTRGLLNDDIANMTASGFGGHLVDVSRGSVVDGGVPLDALEPGAIAGVGLDVLAGGLRIGPRVAASDDVVLQPHHAGGPVETRRVVGQLVGDAFAAHFGGRPLSTPAI